MKLKLVLVPFFCLVWYNIVAEIKDDLQVLVPFFCLVWYNRERKKKSWVCVFTRD